MANSAPTNVVDQSVGHRTAPRSQSFDLAITDDASTTGKFEFASWRGGQIQIPNGLTTVTLTFHSSAKKGGDLDPAYTDAQPPVAITRTVAANQSIPIPADLFGAYEIAIVSDVAGPETINVNVKG